MDLIDRWDAIEALYSVDEYNARSVNAIKNLPSAQPYTAEEIQKIQELESAQVEKAYELGRKSAQPEQRWIPCSERLPEESGYYIITAHDGVGHRTTFVKYQKKAKSWDLTGARSYWRVIAWMPLPEPYQNKERRADGA